MNVVQQARLLVSLGVLTSGVLAPARAQDSATTRGRDTTSSLGASTAPGAANAASQRFASLASAIVQSAGIKPGNLVAISGGPHMVPAMEAYAVEVEKAGGQPLLLLDSPRAIHSYFTEVPEQYLGRPAHAWQDFQATGIDLEIHLPALENVRQVFADVPGERQGKVIAASAPAEAALTERQNRTTMRRLDLNGPPSAADVAQAHLDSAAFARGYEEALNADYRGIAERGRALQHALEGAHRVRVTTPEGTDLTFSIDRRAVMLDAGLVPPGTGGLRAARTAQLPGGSIRLAPVETSVNGKIRAPSDQCDQPVKDEAIDVRNGIPENVRAASDEACVRQAVQRAGRFGWVEIGLNPALRMSDPNVNLASYLLDLGAGAVTVNFGTNQELGGANKTSAGGWYIVLPRATVEADGKVLVRGGELTL
jgi:leucyl aminopeptidase (aminopeptidase T)